MKLKKNGLKMLVILCTFLLLVACKEDDENSLNPDQPISITLWHYYNGNNKVKFDELVKHFNETEGLEKGIMVDALSQGDIDQLKDAVFAAANKQMGAQRLPDIFAAYPDNVYRIGEVIELVDLEKYFSAKELQAYREDFLEVGRIGEERRLNILPVAKSSENLFINKTVWDQFAAATGTTEEQLATWEGVVETAEAYYDWSGGQALLGFDAVANFMIITSMQLEQGLLTYENGRAQFHFNPEIARKIWDTYYVPMINGYFKKAGRFSSDDAKAGEIIAYIGSTAGAIYFPTEVAINGSEVMPIEGLVLPYPVYENGQRYGIMQGAGMAIVKSDAAHEYAAAEFLKWFTNNDQNLSFTASTAYFPVKKEALKEEIVLASLERENVQITPVLEASIKTTLNMFENYSTYEYKGFDGSYEFRLLLENHLKDYVQQDLKSLAEEKTEAERQQLLATYLSEDHFKKWVEAFTKEAHQYVN